MFVPMSTSTGTDQHCGSIHNVYEKLILRAWRYGEPHQGKQQLCLFVDRTSCSQIRSNQFR